ncbi:nose resistant to fluoxetine protein 6 isoform X1 [Dermatophagoides farinae]|uniref:Nose resistant-to-fluoxetine protein N-terminal domain-containing protein n=2 Tax=Dermatophagoides farinae TaxID=6954 RepID=A0A9D4P6H7_DERFA|nr:hypothetical protein HUG17_0717 [Dermatophagoides farinae]
MCGVSQMFGSIMTLKRANLSISIMIIIMMICNPDSTLAINGEQETNSDSINQQQRPIDVIKIWNQHNSQILNVLQMILSQSHWNDHHGQCHSSLKQLIGDARKRKHYAMKMIDSNGRLTSGLLEGRFTNLGQFSECVTTSSESFSGKYCTVYISIPNNLITVLSNISGFDHIMYETVSAKLGVCLPSTCSQEEIEAIARQLSIMFVPELEIKVSNCVEKNDETENPFGLGIFVAICLIFVLLAIMGTIFDHYNLKFKTNGESYAMITKLESQNSNESLSREPTTDEKILLAFSTKQNWQKLFQVTGGESINVFHGLKFLAMFWIIAQHSMSFSSIWINFSNPFDIKYKVYNILEIFLLNGTFSVDIFFFISGYLVMHSLVRSMSADTSRLNLKTFYLNRYIRMTPTMMFLIFFSTTVLRYLGNGPEWLGSTVMFDHWCRNRWFLNLFYVHNFIQTENMCLSHSWYSAVDMQFFLISPLLAILLIRKRWLGMTLILLILFGSIIITSIMTYVNQYPAVPYFNDKIDINIMNSYYKHVYIKPYCRIGPYIIGLLLAHEMMTTRRDVRLSKKTLIAGWLFTATATFGIVMCMLPANNGLIPTILAAAMYSSLSRNLFAVGLAWITFVSITDQGGFVQTLFSLKLWIPLSRLAYCAYLLNPIIIAIFYGSRNQTFEYTPYLLLYFTISNIIVTYLASLMIALFIEYPLITISKILLKR